MFRCRSRFLTRRFFLRLHSLPAKSGHRLSFTQKLWQVGVLVSYLHSTRRVRAGSPLVQEALAITDDGNYHLAGEILDRGTLEDRL